MTTWLLLFTLHSTLWCGLAWVWLRFRPGVHPQMRELVWHTALAASLLTPTAQMFVSPQSTVWHVRVPPLVAPAEDGHSTRGEHGSERHVVAELDWRTAANGVWLAGAFGLLVRYLGRREALRRRLLQRETVRDDRAERTLERLSRAAGLLSAPRLTESESLGSPIALGVANRREICMPSRALCELDGEELTALLAHEIAHHRRRDTIRLGVLRLLEAVFFFQPLIKLVGHDLQRAAEELCDDWAASQLDDHYAMASCLTEVAGWVAQQDRTIPVPCMGRHRSQFAVRVHRLLSDERGTLEPSNKAWYALGSVGLLAVAPWIAPGLAASEELDHDEAVIEEQRHDREPRREEHHEHAGGEHQG
jgi:beta-lactamase regulating signal transducer with metallopeptidase domain